MNYIITFVYYLDSREEVDPKLLVPIFDRLFPCLPQKWRQFLRFGIIYAKEDPEIVTNRDVSAHPIFISDESLIENCKNTLGYFFICWITLYY